MITADSLHGIAVGLRASVEAMRHGWTVDDLSEVLNDYADVLDREACPNNDTAQAHYGCSLCIPREGRASKPTNAIRDFQIAPNDFLILHQHCACASGGYVADAYYASDECNICWEHFGYNVPIVREEGKLTAHLSCRIEKPCTIGKVPYEPCTGCEIEHAGAYGHGQHTCGRSDR